MSVHLFVYVGFVHGRYITRQTMLILLRCVSDLRFCAHTKGDKKYTDQTRI